MIRKWWTQRKAKQLEAAMTDIGREIQDLLLNTPIQEWASGDHTLDHKPSGICLWHANGQKYFRVWAIDEWRPGDASERWNTPADKAVLWPLVERRMQEVRDQPRAEALDRIRLARIKGSSS
jgi:hypothetical protein